MVTAEVTPRKRSPLLRLVKGVAAVGVLASTLGFLYTVIPWYYYFYDARNQIAAVARNGAVETDEELRRRLAQVAKKAGIETEPRDFNLTRSGGAITVKLHYTEECAVTVRGRGIKLFSMGFDISVVADFK